MSRASLSASELKQSFLGRLFVRFFWSIPARNSVLKQVVRVEGGDFRSGTLRRILVDYYGVEVGAHSYGSLLEPGNCDRGAVIGRYVSIGPGVRRFGAAHPIDHISLHPYWYNARLGLVSVDSDVERTTIEIGSDSWIGSGVTILPGCRYIGIGAIVGAGSVVTRDVPDFAIAVGNPARVVRYRLSPNARRAVLDSQYWNYEPQQARQAIAGISELAADPERSS